MAWYYVSIAKTQRRPPCLALSMRTGNREQGVMIPISYHKQIISGTFKHAIDYIVDTKINTEAIEGIYKNDETGASAYSPKMLLKIVLSAYSRVIISSLKIIDII